MTESVTWEISIIGLSLTLFTLANLLTKSYAHKTDLLLGLWLVLINIPFLHAFLDNVGMSSPEFHFYANPTLNLLHGPILYLYVRMLVSSEKLTLQKSELMHLIPFMVLYLSFISMSHPEPMRPSLDNGGPAMDGPGGHLFGPLMAYFGLINGLSFLGYSILTILTLRKHQRNITGIFSQNDNAISLKWLYALPALFAVLVVLNFINENISENSSLVPPLTLHLLCFLSFVVLLCFFGVKQKPVFYFRKPMLLTENTSENECFVETNNDNNAEKTGCDEASDERITQIIEEMQNHMGKEKPYLDPEFSVYSLADALNIPRRTLSQVLNTGLSKNFYQYVNEFRIEEVKTLLGREEHSKTTILDLAFQSGFKSKSSFNSLFKQHCQVTPSQYRKQLKDTQVQ